jgi:Family of unknown function (DUF6461)
VTDVDGTLVEALAGPVAAAVPVLAAQIPPGPAAELGRIGVPPQARPRQDGGDCGAAARAAAARVRAGRPGGAAPPEESPVLTALRAMRPFLAERLLGALAVTVSGLELAGAPDVSAYLGQPPEGPVAFAHAAAESQVLTAVALLDRLRPGATDLAASLTRQLAGHELVIARQAVAQDATDETSIAAAHGAAHLAVAVAVATAVIGRWQPPARVGGRAAAVVGVSIGAAVLSLRDAPMPAAYDAAVLEKARREYVLPRHTGWSVPVAGHRFALTEGEVPETADFTGNGLVTVVPGGAVIRTGAEQGSMRVQLGVTEQPPPLETLGWDEVVEVSWHADRGLASVTGPDEAGDPPLTEATPPWPGDYRLRVHARGRDDADEDESYRLAVWAAPPGPAIVHKRTDRLGYRLRGEPEPGRPQPPERAYRWVRHSSLHMAATVTVVTGSSADDVLRAFDADPARPESLSDISDDVTARMAMEPWVAVLDTGGAVLAVEYNGFEGFGQDVLCRASARGRAASMFWNVNAMTRLSFAEGGHVLASFEPPEEIDAGPAVAAALGGLDFEDYRDKVGKGLVAVQRFTGYGFTEQDLDRIEAADIAYRIAPRAQLPGARLSQG